MASVCDICGNTVAMKLKYDVDECQERGMTFAVPLKVTIRLVVWNKDPETGVKTIRDIKEQEVYFGDIPLMTDNGTFIINGTERVIVSQLHRSPGAFFHSEDKTLYVAQIIPYRGSWVEFEYDQKNLLYVRIDRKRKFLATVFLRALGLRGADEIIRTFYSVDRVFLNKGNSLLWAVNDSLVGLRAAADVKAGDFLVQNGKKITANAIAALRKARIETIAVADEALEGAFAAADIVDPETGEVILEANEELTPRVVSMAQEKKVEKLEIFFPERDETGPIISQTLKKDPIRTHEEALIEIYRRLRPGDPPTLDSSRSLFENMFFNPQKYDFSRVGRLKLNTKLSLTTPLDERVLALMLPFVREHYGNASSRHEFGTRARKAVNQAREQVAALINVQPVQIVFTSGGTEANNAFIKGAAGMLKPSQIAVSAIEHPCVARPAEALARNGIARLVLIDLDHIAESNINRQVHALEPTLGQAKVKALQERIALIHPDCKVVAVEEFVDEANVAGLLQVGATEAAIDGVIDCCDQVRAKAAIAAWGAQHGVPVVSVGAAGGKCRPQDVEVADLAEVTHDPLLASLRQRLRQRHGGARKGRMGLACVFSREAVRPPQDRCDVPTSGDTAPTDGSLNCAGYGSSVMVTATFGMVAAAEMVSRLLR